MGGRFENFTPPTLGSELTLTELTTLEELNALANSSAGQFVRKENGVFVNATLAETIALSGLSDVAISSPSSGQVLTYNGSSWANSTLSAGSGTVTSVSVATANGISGSVANGTSAAVITLSLGAITPTSIQVSGLTASEILGTDASKNIVSLAVATYPSLTELTYVKGVTSAIQTQFTGKAALALSNLASVAINTTLVSDTDNTDALGTTAIAWSDLFLGSGAVIQFNSAPSTADVTITHSANTLTLAGGNLLIDNLTASEIVITDASKNLVSAAVATYPSLTELTYVKGVTSALQTQINAKAPSTSPTFATSITGSYLTASEILITDGSKNIVSAAVATYPSLTELTYVKGVTSAIQTQINTKSPSASPTFTGTVTLPKTIEIQDTSADHQYVLAVSELAADRTITLPLLLGADTFVFADFIQTLNNKRINPRVVTTTDDATAVIDVDVTDQYQLTAMANATTISTTGTPVAGQKLIIRLTDNGTGRALTWDAVFVAIGVTLPTTTVANKRHYIGCIYNATSSKFDVVAVVAEA